MIHVAAFIRQIRYDGAHADTKTFIRKLLELKGLLAELERCNSVQVYCSVYSPVIKGIKSRMRGDNIVRGEAWEQKPDRLQGGEQAAVMVQV